MTTSFFPVGGDMEAVGNEWCRFLREDQLFRSEFTMSLRPTL